MCGTRSARHQAVGAAAASSSGSSVVRPFGRQQRLHVRANLLNSSASATKVEVDRIRKLRLITAVKTPYRMDGKFDLPAYDRILENQIANGVEGVIVGGTTGEGQLMSWDEHVMLIAHTVNVFGRDLCVIGNTGSNSTSEAVHATEQGFAVGMHAALQINPYYGKTSKQGLRTHFQAVLNEGPAIVYNVPGRTGQDIPDDIVHELAQHANFLGMKECTGNKRIAAYTSKGITCWSGNDDEAHDARHDAGAVGVISVTSNVVPGLMSKLMHARDSELNQSMMELYSWMFCEPNPISLNTALAMCGVARPVFRLPYVPLSKEQREQGAKLLRKFQEDIPGCKEVRVMEDADFTLIERH
jgi:4-hydroxy-tetrahydrodipicolinate synthase